MTFRYLQLGRLSRVCGDFWSVDYFFDINASFVVLLYSIITSV